MKNGLRLTQFACRSTEPFDFTIDYGQCVGLTGPSGTGKTVLVRALADLDPYSGAMSLDGVDAAQMPPPRWRRQVGLLPAESAWWFDTVGEHFGQIAEDWLSRMGFSKEALTWQISQLSSGERQRFALLRLLVQQPRILLLDEPTANLDAKNSARVERLVNDYRHAHQPGIIWISHDIEQLKRQCDPVYFLDNRTLTLVDLNSGNFSISDDKDLS